MDQTREAPLLHEVPQEGRVGEQQVIEFVHAEVEDLVHILSSTQVLIEGLDLPCRREDEADSDRGGLEVVVTSRGTVSLSLT